MPRWSFARAGSGALCLAVGCCLSPPSQAAEYALGAYLLGLTIPMSGYIPPPGFYFSNTYLLYQGSGNLYPKTRVTYNFVADVAILAWISEEKLFGASIGVAATVPFVGDRNRYLVNQTTATQSAINSIGDSELSAVLGWHAGDNNWCLIVTGFMPTGNYDPARIVQTGLHRPALDIKGAYTFLSYETGLEASAALGMTFNAPNTATNYQSGAELHFEWALNEHLPFGAALGVGGFFYQQVTSDGGVGDLNGAFKGRIAAVGPLVSYTLKAGPQEVTLSGRWFHEFAAQNRVSGDLIFASLSFPF